MDTRRDGTFLIPLPPVDGMPHLPAGVFPETLKDLKTLDGLFHYIMLRDRFIVIPKILVQASA
jgi:hypothetical protein